MSDKFDGISDYVAQTVQLCREIAPALCFGETDEQSRIVFDGVESEARFVRVGLTQPGILHLRWIELYAHDGGKLVNVAPQGSVSASSTKPGKEKLIAKGKFLRAHGGAYGFHTDMDERPWVCVDLGAPVDLRRVVVVNRNDIWASRAARLTVDTSLDGIEWQPLYDHAEAARQVLAMLARRPSHGGLEPSLRQMIERVVVSALSADYDRANELLRGTPGYGRQTKNQIAHAVTAHVLAPRRLEWTNHSVKRTFRYWTEEEKQDYLRFANAVAGDIIGLGYDTCIGYGGVLSIVRDNDLIQHDDDLDLIVSLPRHSFATIGEGLDALSAKLQELGYKVSGDYATHRHVSRPPNRRPVDVFAGFEEGEFVSWMPGPRRELRKSDVFPGIWRPLLGVQCLLPRDPLRYVEAVYGPEWMVPISRWNHTWDKAAYRDWFEAQVTRTAKAASS